MLSPVCPHPDQGRLCARHSVPALRRLQGRTVRAGGGREAARQNAKAHVPQRHDGQAVVPERETDRGRRYRFLLRKLEGYIGHDKMKLVETHCKKRIAI